MSDITITDEAILKAAIELYYDARGLGNNSWEEAPAWEREDFCRKARLVVDAALNAWPKSYSLTENDSAVIRDVAAIILPLPKEPEI